MNAPTVIFVILAQLITVALVTYLLSETIKRLENLIIMKNSEVKEIVAAAAAKSTEAFSEIKTRIADQQKQIDDLIAGAGDPEVTDEVFLANLNTLKDTTNALADIVPNATPPPVPENPPVT